jgi:outer membrane protein insertion porin family
MKVRASVGAGVLWDSPFGPLRLDYAYAFSKEQECTGAVTAVVGGIPQNCDKLQAIRFGGGTKF